MSEENGLACIDIAKPGDLSLVEQEGFNFLPAILQ